MEQALAQEQPKVLDVRSLLQATYEQFGQRHTHQRIVFEYPATAEIANDGDYNHPKSADFFYSEVQFFPWEQREWVLGFGKWDHGYPAGEMNADLIAFPHNPEAQGKDLADQITKEIKRAKYLRYSLIHVYSDGNILLAPRSSHYARVERTAIRDITRYVTQRAEYDHSIIPLDTMIERLRPLTTRATSYRPEAVPFLVGIIEEVLHDSKISN